MIIFVVTFLAVWTGCLLYIGLSDLFKMLGGASIFYFLLPLIVIFFPKHKTLLNIMLSIVLTMIGFIAVNFLYTYFSNNYEDYTLLIRIYVIFIPVGLILMGYGCTLQSYLLTKKNHKVEKIGNDKNIAYFGAFFVAIHLYPLFLTIPIIIQLRELNNINVIGYQVALGSIVIGSLIFLTEIRRIPIETINYFAKPLHRFDFDIKKIKKLLIICLPIFLVFSAIEELRYRGGWIIWGETMAAFIIYTLILYGLSQVLFVPFKSFSDESINVNLPSIKSKTNMVIVGLFIFIFFILIFLIIVSGPPVLG